jgi:hypothetical protein
MICLSRTRGGEFGLDLLEHPRQRGREGEQGQVEIRRVLHDRTRLCTSVLSAAAII